MLFMRIAVLADIHGNLAALEAALARIERLRVDQLLVAGDVVVGSPDSVACWERVKALRCPMLRGNHERYVFDLGTERAAPEWSTPRFGPVQAAAQQLGAARRAEMAALPILARLPHAPDLLFVHGSSRSDIDQVFPFSSDADLDRMFAGTTERFIARGHNHYGGVHLWGERHIVTVGSVGLPLDGNVAAHFCIFERTSSSWRIEHHVTPYDVADTLRRFREDDYLRRTGPMGQLFMREVETATFHILPFLRFYGEAAKNGEPPELGEAVRAFLHRT